MPEHKIVVFIHPRAGGKAVVLRELLRANKGVTVVDDPALLNEIHDIRSREEVLLKNIDILDSVPFNRTPSRGEIREQKRLQRAGRR